MCILNPDNDPYLHFAEEQRRRGKRQFSPWTTSDPELLKIAKLYFPEIPLVPASLLEKPDLSPVEILALQDYPELSKLAQEASYIAVGGPPAAAVALQAALNGKPVLYVSDLDPKAPGKMARPIWAGAGNHGEPDALTEAPAYIAGYHPFTFIFKEMLRVFLPSGYNTRILKADYSWLSLNWMEWLKNPRQWAAAFRIAWGNHQLAKRYAKALKRGKTPAVLREMQERAQASGKYLEALNKNLGGLIREPRGSLLIAASPKQLQTLLQDRDVLQAEGRQLLPLKPEEAEEKYGFRPRQALGLMEKTHDFIFEPDFLKKLTDQILACGGEVKSNWRLKRVYVDNAKSKGGVMEFCELTAGQEKLTHYRKFSQAHLSLGPTPFRPTLYDLISVTGVSINTLILGANLKGGPIVCGGSNHLVPLLPPRTIELPDPRTGKTQAVTATFARLSAAGSVSPLDRGKNWYTYDGRHAIHLLHRVRETLPPEMIVKILSVTGCNRVIGKDGRQVELHPTIVVKNKKIICEQVTIQTGAGGGGLTQMGALPKKMAEESNGNKM